MLDCQYAILPCAELEVDLALVGAKSRWFARAAKILYCGLGWGKSIFGSKRERYLNLEGFIVLRMAKDELPIIVAFREDNGLIVRCHCLVVQLKERTIRREWLVKGTKGVSTTRTLFGSGTRNKGRKAEAAEWDKG